MAWKFPFEAKNSSLEGRGSLSAPSRRFRARGVVLQISPEACSVILLRCSLTSAAVLRSSGLRSGRIINTGAFP